MDPSFMPPTIFEALGYLMFQGGLAIGFIVGLTVGACMVGGISEGKAHRG